MAQNPGFREQLSRATTPVLEFIDNIRGKKPRDKFKVELVAGSVTLNEENRPATWKRIRQYFTGHEEQRKAGYQPHEKHRHSYIKILETGRDNVLAVLDYCRDGGFEAPTEADFMLMRYGEWLDGLAQQPSDHSEGTLPQSSTIPTGTDQFPDLEDPAIKAVCLGPNPREEDRVLDAFNRAVAASLADVQGRDRDQDRGLGDLFGGDRDPPGAEGLDSNWGIPTADDYGARPRDGTGCTEPTVGLFPQIPATAPPRGATVGATVSGMTLDQLRWVIQSIVSEKSPAAPQGAVTQTRGCDNKRYKDLEPLKFEGDRKEYPAFRQSLRLCLDRMDFPTGKDKAIYVFKFLKGPVREKCSYFMSTLTEHSYQHMLDFLDDGYGTDESYDLVAIERLAALPKLRELNQDNVLDHLAVIGAATGPLMKISPEALRTPNGEKYFKLLRTLPVRDQDQYFTECRMFKAPRTMESLTAFLRSKLRDRKHGGALGSSEPEEGTTRRGNRKGKGNRRFQRSSSRKRTEKVFLNVPDETSGESDAEDHPSCGEEEDAELTYAVTEAKCPACGEKHGLDKCPKFLRMDLAQRREIAHKEGLCNCCLRAGHFGRECRSKKRCGTNNCRRYHHALLHDETFLRYLAMEEGCESDLE